jgi:DNA polymerase-3 subunit chi
MTEILFYHLDRQPLERVLPDLLEKCIERGWRAVVQAGSEERRDALDAHLWTYRDEAFLPHGTVRDGSPAEHPVWITMGDENPNGANVRFLVDGADISHLAGYARIVMLFNGNDQEMIERARAAWKAVRAEGHEATYWQQSERGRWEKKA